MRRAWDWWTAQAMASRVVLVVIVLCLVVGISQNGL